ncbi:hypothetical protein H072_9440 [Dactylellina haptotyla CBS 200.50]|uniref:Carbohydrate kinase PfkB domain-containing protein n=1 Tax=Dactylellina haptotyla (strain CBS 200.50) TaxID=1284197 RepID=S8A762_DACHA|nr:hypothetical protein H072_9440 [Dactylellina haptotyla CBS 200.50]
MDTTIESRDTSPALAVQEPRFSILALGALYRDVIIKVPTFPAEDAKQSAISETSRVGGNISNTLSVLSQVVVPGTQLLYATVVGGPEPIWRCVHSFLTFSPIRPLFISQSTTANNAMAQNNRPLISALEAKGITMLYQIRGGEDTMTPTAYIFESQGTGSRTIISHQLIAPLKTSEVLSLLFAHFFPKSTFLSHAYDDMLSRVYNAQSSFFPSWIHFEGRECFMAEGVIDHFRGRREYKERPCTISVEFETYGRPGLDRLLGLCDVAFVAEGYIKAAIEDQKLTSWDGDDKAYMIKVFAGSLRRVMKRSAIMFVTVGAGGAYIVRFQGAGMEHIPTPDIPTSEIIETTGAGDTFIGAAIYALGYKRMDPTRACKIAVYVASRKCMQVGYDGLGSAENGFAALEGNVSEADIAMSPGVPKVRPTEGLL